MTTTTKILPPPLLLPQPNLKAKDLPEDYLPRPEIIKAYEDANQEFEFDNDATTHDRVWKYHFWPKVNGNVRIKEQEIRQEITAVIRVKNSEGEWLIYHIILFGTDHIGVQVDFDDLIGMVDKIPVFERRVNPNTGEIEVGPGINGHKKLYKIPFTKAKVQELSKHFSEDVQFSIVGNGRKRISCSSLEEFCNMDYQSIIDRELFLTEWRQRKEGGGN